MGDDKTCINKNRDVLLTAFCNFRKGFDAVLQENGLKDGKHYWPNICCKSNNDSEDSCADPTGSIPREEIVPFALAQGGKVTYTNLYGEVVDVLKKKGYLHRGMLKILEEVKVDASALKSQVNKQFKDVQLCPPKLFKSPRSKAVDMCELLYPYSQLLDGFQTSFERLFSIHKLTEYLRAQSAETNFMQLMQTRQRAHTKAAPLMAAMKAKQGTKSAGTCPTVLRGDDEKSLEAWKNEFCKGFRHVDLADKNVENIAMIDVSKDISLGDDLMHDLSKAARFRVKDKCTSPMFSAGDISLQKVNGEWVGLVLLDSTSEDGYIRRELPQCKSLPYLPSTDIKVKVFADTGNCCEETKNANLCDNSCLASLKHHHTNEDLEYVVDVKGTLYGMNRGHTSRRRLLRYRRGRC